MIGITRFAPLEYAQGERDTWTWAKLGRFVSHPLVAAAKEAPGGFSLTHYCGDYRLIKNVESVFAVGLDFDKTPHTPKEIADMLQPYTAFIYTTFSHAPGAPRCRGILKVSRPMQAFEHSDVLSVILEHLEAENVLADRKARDASRLWYRPARAEGAAFEFYENRGKPVDVDQLLKIRKRQKTVQIVVPRATNVIAFPASTFARARRYIAKMPASIQGQDGSGAMFAVARKLVCDFELCDADVWDLLCEYNERAVPKWSAKEIKHKIESAKTARIKNPIGGQR